MYAELRHQQEQLLTEPHSLPQNPPYELPWNGEPFTAPILAFDTETVADCDLKKEIPQLVLATVSDGERAAVIHPDQLWAFIRAHDRCPFVGHNIQFDYWVVSEYLRKAVGEHTGGPWEDRPDRGLMDDTMLLDFLVRLGTPGVFSGDYEGKGLRNLGEVAADYGMEADKESPYRMRFHELIGQDWSKVDRGFFDYAVADAWVTARLYRELVAKAALIACVENKVEAGLIETHGLLTSKLQTRASIVLSQIGRNGMALDQQKVSESLNRMEWQICRLIVRLARFDPLIFGKYKKRSKNKVKYEVWEPCLRPATKAGLPSVCTEHLKIHLESAAKGAGIDPADLPRSDKTNRLTLVADTWKDILPDHPFVSQWAELKEADKTLQLLSDFQGVPSVHPKFIPLVRTGRTSCSKPNMQQQPREAWFRSNFIARPGHVFLIADYSAIELVTLAAVLEHKYGHSVLAQVLREGRKPHDYTASIISGIDYEDMVAGVKREKAEGKTGPYSQKRQAAKAINFGVPGGLGAAKLAVYAKQNYGVDLSIEQAWEFRRQLIEEVYPELSLYLRSDDLGAIATNIHCPKELLIQALGLDHLTEEALFWKSRSVVDVIARGGLKRDGNHAALSWRALVWSTIQSLNKNPALTPILAAWRSTPRNQSLLVGSPVTTLTGRVRAGAEYSEVRNTPFQGLAADGAKVALWKIYRAGLKIVHFVHDEIICECPEGRAEEAKGQLVRLMQEGMSEVIQTDIPVEIEATISKTWSK